MTKMHIILWAIIVMSSVYLGFFAYSLFPTRPKETIPYPQNQSYLAFTKSVVNPYFHQQKSETIQTRELSFQLWNLMPEIRRSFFIKETGYDVYEAKKQYSHATLDIRQNQYWASDGIKKKTDGVSIPFVLYDLGRGFFLTFPNTDFKAYFVPAARYTLRVYTISPDLRQFWDKTYEELDEAVKQINNPNFYTTLLRVMIKGDFGNMNKLSAYEQEVLIDILTIGVAEAYWDSTRPIENRTALRMNLPYSRGVPPLANALLGQYYNLGVRQIYKNRKENKLVMGGAGRMKSFYDNAKYLPEERLLNEKIITDALRAQHPHEFAYIEERVGKKYADNFFNMVAQLSETPEWYDAKTQDAVEAVILRAEEDVKKINEELDGYWKRYTNGMVNLSGK